MSVDTHRVLMGACGWKHQAWLNNFYSEDLPEEWQLGFYSNEFPVVYVSADDWLNGSNLDISEWAEDVSDNFRFILEVPAKVLNDESQFLKALEKAESLDEFCLGLVLQLNSETSENISLFQKNIERAKALTLVSVDNEGILFSNEIKNVLHEQNITEVWDGISTIDDSMKRGSLAISHISGESLNMAGLRKVIEGCLTASNEERTSVLIIDGNPPSLELLRNADIILNLL